MRVVFTSIVLGLTWFAVINLHCTAVAVVLAKAVGQRRISADLLLALRLLPAVASLIFVFGLFLPVHARFEPAQSDERAGVVIAALAGLALVLIGRSALRAARILRIDMQLEAMTRRVATQRGVAFEVTGLSGVSLAGILRPKILVGSGALAALTPAELDVAISHEIAHRRSLDNLKRFLICCAPDAFGWFGAAGRVEERWEAETECQADAHAVRGDNERAVTLASALVKVSRLAGAGSIGPSPAWSAFHVPTLLETRVRRLVDGRATAPRTRIAWWMVMSAALALPAIAWLLNYSYTLHLVTEALVTYLP